MAYHVLMCQ